MKTLRKPAPRQKSVKRDRQPGKAAFEELLRGLLHVPKAEIDQEQKKYDRRRRRKRKKAE